MNWRLTCLLLIFFGKGLIAQNTSIGISTGLSHYFGDVATEYYTENIRANAGIWAKYNFRTNLGIRISANYIRVAGIDSIAKSNFQKGRNLNFFSDIYEINTLLEYDVIRSHFYRNYGKDKLGIFLLGGVGMFYFVPKTIVNGKVYNLATAGTSGFSYSQYALCFPLGARLEYKVHSNWSIGLESIFRFTTTSDLDDIRGYSYFPNPNILSNEDDFVVYNRSGLAQSVIKTGKLKRRGRDLDITDMYFTFNLSLTYHFN